MLIVWIAMGLTVLLLVGCFPVLRRRGPGASNADHASSHEAKAAAATRQAHNGPGLFGPNV